MTHSIAQREVEAVPLTEQKFRVPLRDRVKDYFDRNKFESFCEKYGVTNEVISEAVQLIEEYTGLKFAKRVKSGNLNISLIDEKGEDKILEASFKSTIRDIGGIRKGKIVEIGKKKFDYAKLLDVYKEFYAVSKIAFYGAEDNRVFIRKDKIEEAAMVADFERREELVAGPKQIRMVSKKPDRKAAGSLLLEIIIHEMTHQLVFTNNPSLDIETSRLEAETFKLALEVGGVDENSKAYLESRAKDVLEKGIVFKAWVEAVAEYTSSSVMKRLGFEPVRSSDDHYIKRGRELLAEVERATKENPIPRIVKNPPISIEEIENPQKYLERMKA